MEEAMYKLWISLCILMLIAYVYLEGKIWFYLVRKNSGQTDLSLPGRRWYYIVGSAIIGFVIVASAYLALVDFVRVQAQSACWVLPSLIIAILSGVSTSATLRNATFSHEK